MLMKYIYLFMTVFFALFLGSCNDEGVNDQSGVKVDNDAQKAIDVFMNYRAELNNSLSRANDDLTIEKVDEMNVPIQVAASRASTFSRAIDSDKVDLKLHVISFKSKGEPGFSIVSSDERVRSTFMYTEKGSIEDTAYIVPVAEFIRNIPQICADELYMYYSGETGEDESLSRATQPTIYLDMKTKWDQTYPYWDGMPYITCDGTQRHAYVGCTAVALAQCAVFCGLDSLPPYNFAKMRNIVRLSTSNPMYGQVTQLLYEIGRSYMDYRCDGTFGGLGESEIEMLWLGFSRSYDYVMKSDNSLDKSKFYSCLQAGCPTAMSGVNSQKKGHSWVLHGQRYNGKTREIYCNYGWGGDCDGWYSDWQRPVHQNTMQPAYASPFYKSNFYFFFLRKKS